MEKRIEYPPKIYPAYRRHYDVNGWGDPDPSLSIEANYSVLGSDIIEHGPNIPDWYQRIKTGRDATTYLYGRSQTMKVSQWGHVLFRWYSDYGPTVKRRIGMVQGAIAYLPMPKYRSADVALEARVDAEALGNFMKSVQNSQTALAGGTVLGELRETIAMVKSPVRSLRRGMRDYLDKIRKVQSKVRTPEAASKVVSDTYLEYAFGWRPLISDIQDGVQALSDLSKDLHPWHNVSGTASDEVVSRIRYPDANIGYVRFKCPYAEIRRFEVKYRGQVSGETNQFLADARTFGFTPWEIAPTIYQLLPWSFLVDYFSNLGTIVTAASYASSGINWVNRTYCRESINRSLGGYSYLFDSSIIYGIRFERFKQYKAETKSREVERAPYTGSLVPRLHVSLPDADSVKWVNVAALIRSTSDIASSWRF